MSKKIMKRSLALGALMAFVITGSAMAGTLDGKNYYLSGANENVAGNAMQTPPDYILNGAERVIGGWSTVDGSVTILNSNFQVTGGSFGMVVGGNYTGSSHNMTVASTNIVIDGATVKQVIGGTGFNSVDGNDNTAGRSTNVTILSGSFGGVIDNTDCPEMHVVAGDLLKSFGYSPTNHNINTTIDNTNLTIEDGTFNAAVYGGSAATRMYAGCAGNELKAVVNNASISISGGTFNDAIVAGGLAWGHVTNSIVKNATVDITGGIFNNGADIYAGGLDGSNGAGYETAISNVENARINISDVTVNNIYGTGGNISFTAAGDPYPGGGNERDWEYKQNTDAVAVVSTDLKLTNVTADDVVIPLGSVTLRVEDDENTKGEINIGQSEGKTGLTVTEDGDNKVTVSVEANGEVNDAYAGDYKKMVEERFKVEGYALLEEDEETGETSLKVDAMTVEEGEVMGAATLNSDGTITTTANQGNTGIKDIVATGLIFWRYEMNDMNKRMGELRNANGEHGVWVRMVRGETEYNSVKNQYNQYQLGYDEKLSVDPSWTVGVALSYTEADNNFSKGTGESTNKALSIYGSKLNDDGTFIDLIAKYARLENDFDLGTAKGDYDTNGYSFSAEYGKRIQQGNGLWIEPQVELTYGQVDGATYIVGGRTVNQDNMESLIGRVGFSLGKDISKGNVYARASYLYDFEGETSATFSKERAVDSFEQDLGGGWWEVGVGANINLSKATYIYADIEKTFGGEVDTNWQWNLGVRYSF